MNKILIDTDVVLDFFFDRHPFSEYSAKIFALCERKKILGFVTPNICSNAYYVLRRTARHEKVVEKIRLLLSITDVISMDKNTVINAINSDFKDFEDALQTFAAIDNGNIDVIITRNIKDFKNSKIVVLTPESYLRTVDII